MVDNHKKNEETTPGLAARTCSNCFTSSGGDILSVSAPSIAVGISTSEVRPTIAVRIWKSQSQLQKISNHCSFFTHYFEWSRNGNWLSWYDKTCAYIPWLFWVFIIFQTKIITHKQGVAIYFFFHFFQSIININKFQVRGSTAPEGPPLSPPWSLETGLLVNYSVMIMINS